MEEIIRNRPPAEVISQMERWKGESEKKSVEDSVRDHLHGFSRTIPSFIMAYGDEKLTLANFDEYTEDDGFQELTEIIEEDFRFLRDGGEYTDSDTGEVKRFGGHLFDETVFNDSMKNFCEKGPILPIISMKDVQKIFLTISRHKRLTRFIRRVGW